MFGLLPVAIIVPMPVIIDVDAKTIEKLPRWAQYGILTFFLGLVFMLVVLICLAVDDRYHYDIDKLVYWMLSIVCVLSVVVSVVACIVK